jgi:hypothetical protein
MPDAPVQPRIDAGGDHQGMGSDQVVEHAPNAADQTLPQCDAASPQGGPKPCWYLTGAQSCQSGTGLVINRIASPATGTSVTVRCSRCG